MRVSRGQSALATSLNRRSRPQRQIVFAVRLENATLICSSNRKRHLKRPIVNARRLQSALQASTSAKIIPRLLTGFAMHATIQKGNGRMVLTKQTAKLCRRAASMRKFLMWAVLLKILHARRVRVATNNLPETTNCRIATEQQQRRRKRAPQRREQVRQRQKRLHPSPQQP